MACLALEDLTTPCDFFHSWRRAYCGWSLPDSPGWSSDWLELLQCIPSLLIIYSLEQTVFWVAVHDLNFDVEELNVNFRTGFICVCMHVCVVWKDFLRNGGECSENARQGSVLRLLRVACKRHPSMNCRQATLDQPSSGQSDCVPLHLPLELRHDNMYLNCMLCFDSLLLLYCRNMYPGLINMELLNNNACLDLW